MAQHHMAFTGTVTLPPSTLIQVVRDVVMALARHGFDRFFFVNGHGGNIAPVSTAFSEIHTELAEASAFRAPGGNAPPAELRCMLKNWWMEPGVTALKQKLYGDKEGRSEEHTSELQTL